MLSPALDAQHTSKTSLNSRSAGDWGGRSCSAVGALAAECSELGWGMAPELSEALPGQLLSPRALPAAGLGGGRPAFDDASQESALWLRVQMRTEG